MDFDPNQPHEEVDPQSFAAADTGFDPNKPHEELDPKTLKPPGFDPSQPHEELDPKTLTVTSTKASPEVMQMMAALKPVLDTALKSIRAFDLAQTSKLAVGQREYSEEEKKQIESQPPIAMTGMA